MSQTNEEGGVSTNFEARDFSDDGKQSNDFCNYQDHSISNGLHPDNMQSCTDNTYSWQKDASQPYVCAVCKKTFRHLNVLKTHARVHTGNQIMQFKIKANDLIHSFILSGEKPYSCTTCHRSFAHKSTLNEHMNLHSDNMPYQCDVCKRRFKQRKSLRVHRCE